MELSGLLSVCSFLFCLFAHFFSCSPSAPRQEDGWVSLSCSSYLDDVNSCHRIMEWLGVGIGRNCWVITVSSSLKPSDLLGLYEDLKVLKCFVLRKKWSLNANPAAPDPKAAVAKAKEIKEVKVELAGCRKAGTGEGRDHFIQHCWI